MLTRSKKIALIFGHSLAGAIISFSCFLIYDALTNSPRHSFNPDHLDPDNYAYISDPETGYRNRPSYQKIKRREVVVKGKKTTLVTPVFHNAIGARVAGPDLPVPEQVGVIAVGGSQTWGQGVREEQTFPAVFARLIEETEGNFAISGTGGVSSYFESKSRLALNPKWVIYGFWEDHLNRNLRSCTSSGFPFCTPLPRVILDAGKGMHFELPDDPEGKLVLGRKYLKTMYATKNEGFALKDVVWAFRRTLRRLDELLHPKSYDKASEDEKIDAAIFVHDNMARAANEAGAKLVVVYIPLYFSKTIHAANPRLVEAAKNEDYIFIDAGMALSKYKKSGGVIEIPGDGHLSVEGHKVLAQAIFQVLIGKGLIE